MQASVPTHMMNSHDDQWMGWFSTMPSQKIFQKEKVLPPKEGNLHDTTIYPTNTAYSAFEKDSLMVIPNKIRVSGRTAKK